LSITDELQAEVQRVAARYAQTSQASHRPYNCVVRFAWQRRFSVKKHRGPQSEEGWAHMRLRVDMAIAVTNSGLVAYNATGISGDNSFEEARLLEHYPGDDRRELFELALHLLKVMEGELAA